MRNLIRFKQIIFWLAAVLLLAGINSCDKDKEEEEEIVSESIEVTISFDSFKKPAAGQKLVSKLFYDDVKGISIINSTPAKLFEKLLTEDDIINGLTITFDDILIGADEIYICAYVDINENGVLDTGDLAVFYDNISLEEVELNVASPTNLSGMNSVDINLNIIYDSVMDADGNEYSSVVLGNQEWFSENLRTTKFMNGDDIPNGSDLSNADWFALLDQEDGSGSPAFAQHTHENHVYTVDGLLYNWYVVTDLRGICPAGWRVPSDDDWKQLETYLGMPGDELDVEGFRGGNVGIGTQLKIAEREFNGTNESGFNAPPSGIRNPTGAYARFDIDCFLWTTTETPGNFNRGMCRVLRNSEAGIHRHQTAKAGGLTIRCVRNIE